MKHPLRILLALMAVLALSVGVVACSDDDGGDDSASDDTTTTTEAPDGGDDEGPPEENPCGPDGTGEFGPPGEEPAPGATDVTVTAADFSFEGVEDISTPGNYALTFTNEGEELHELVILKIQDGETRSVDELLALPEEESDALVSDVGFVFACPGDSTGPVGVSIDEPGRYVAFCFIPVGTMADTDFSTMSEEGAPHFTEGMMTEWTVG